MSSQASIATIADLAKDGSISDEIVAAWLALFRATPGAEALTDFPLTELQRVVANDPAARSPSSRNLVIAGPTSAGKTLAAEILMARLLTSATPPYGCVYAVPLRVLATEKWERFKAVFGKEDVYVSSGDYQDQDSYILNRRFRIAVVVYEKLYGWWLQKNSRNAILRNMGMLVVDELQMIGDIQRGPRLELLLTFLRRLQLKKSVKFRIVGLGPKQEALARIATWQDADLLAPAIDERPVPLAEGYVCPGGPAQFVGTDPRVKQLQIFVPPVRATTRDGMLKDIVSGLLKRDKGTLDVGRGKRILVYSPTKDGAERLAVLLTDALGIRQRLDEDTLKALDALERTHATARLRKTMAAGVGFHHGDLTFGERGVVEGLFRAEAPASCLDVVVCTPTLAMGVNLPADYMLFASSESYKPNDWDEKQNLPTPLTPLEYHNFAGRAGRYRPNAPPGHHGVALFISERKDIETRREIVEPIILGRIMPVASEMHRWPFGFEPLALAAAESLAAVSNRPVPLGDVVDLFAATYAGVTTAGPDPKNRGAVVEMVEPKLTELARSHSELISPKYVVNRPGIVVARAGIHVQTYEALKSIAERVRDGILDNPLVILEELAVVPEIVRLYPTSLSDHAREQAKVARALRAFLREMTEAGHVLGPQGQTMLGQTFVPDRGTLEALMRVAASWLWIEGRSAQVLSEQLMLPGIRYGACNLLGDQLHWLVSTLPELWDALGLSDADDEAAAEQRWAMGRLERRLRFGVPNELVSIAQLRVPGLHRENMLELWDTVAKLRGRDRGWEHPVELLDVPAKAMGDLRKLFRALRRAILGRPWSDDPRQAWQRQVDVARLASDGDGRKYVDPNWIEALDSLWTEKDSTKLGAVLARALGLKPLLLNVREQQRNGSARYFIQEAGRDILVSAVGDGESVSWEEVRRLWGAEGPTGAPVDGVLVLANGTVDDLGPSLEQYGEPIRVVTKEALGHLIVQSLVAPEDDGDQSELKPMVRVVREWLCGDAGHFLGTAHQAEETLRSCGLDASSRDARWLQGRPGPKKLMPPVEDVRERSMREMKLDILRKDIEYLPAVGDAAMVPLVESVSADLLAEVDRIESEPKVVVAHVRISLEELVKLCLTDHSLSTSGTLEKMLERVAKQTAMPASWSEWATTHVRKLSNQAHHPADAADALGRFTSDYSFDEALELLTTTVRLWRDYLELRPIAPLSKPTNEVSPLD